MSTHYTIRGGASNNGAYCGAFFVLASPSAGYAYWGHGAALSFKLDRLNLFSYI